MPIVLRICPPIQNTSIILADEIRRPIGYWATRRLSLSEGHVSRLVSRPISRPGPPVIFFGPVLGEGGFLVVRHWQATTRVVGMLGSGVRSHGLPLPDRI